jgi:uncharacterized protein
MKIVALTDLHGNPGMIGRFRDVLASADLVLLVGDNTHFGHGKETEDIVQAIRQYNPNIYAVSGNCDYPDAEQKLAEMAISLNGRCVGYKDIFLAGMSGSLPCPGTTPHEYDEDEYALYLEWLEKEIRHPLILVTHQPPVNTLNDLVPSGSHVGSKAIRRFIENVSPLVCLTGHIHEGRGIDTIGMTPVINPGPARDGNYASLMIENKNVVDVKINRL